MASLMATSALSARSASLKSSPSTTSLKSSSSFSQTAVACPRQSHCPRFAPLVVKAAHKESLPAKIASGLTALSLAAALQFSPLNADVAQAVEANILNQPPPLESHYVDDAGVLNRVTKSDLKRLLTDLEQRTGFHIDVVTLRKITGKGDVFEFADRVLESWYPTLEEGDKKGVVVLITTAKEGAVAGGPTFIQTIGDAILEDIVTENIPVLATAEKYNEAVYATSKRLAARIDGKPDIGGARSEESKRVSNFKSKEETEEKRGQFSIVVGGLLVIAFVVPMVQYYAYVKK